MPGVLVDAFLGTPSGVILHGTRSGVAGTIQQEFDRTVNYVRMGAAGLGWNLTVGDDNLALHIPPDHWGWNARAASRRYLAAEWAQATLDSPISDGQVRAFCWWFVNVARKRYPDLPLAFPNHSDLSEGAADGKTDVEPSGRHSVRDRVLAHLRDRYGVTK